MNFNKHGELEGRHSFLSPSKAYWLNDDDEQLVTRFRNSYATELGTILHDIARKHIKFGYKLNRNDRKSIQLDLLDKGIPGSVLDGLNFDAIFANLSAYVNDSIGFGMKPEVVLYYSDNCFGTTDAISYSEKERLLRIHDYKSGTTPAKMEQLMIYAALFCLEYRVRTTNFACELRIYQNSEIVILITKFKTGLRHFFWT